MEKLYFLKFAMFRRIPKFSNVNSDFAPAAKVSFQREPIPYICGLRARIECEPVSEHSTRSDRVTNIGYRLSLEASVLLRKSGFMIFFLVIRYHRFSLMFAKSAVNQFPYDVIDNRKHWNSDNHTDNAPHSAK